MGALGLHIVFSLPTNSLFITLFGKGLGNFDAIAGFFGYLAIPAGLIGLYYMNRCYRIKARPFWNHWQVATSFFGNMLSLGAFIGGVIVVTTLGLSGEKYQSIVVLTGSMLVLGMGLEAIGLVFHNRAMNSESHEGAASHYIQCTTFGKTYYLRNCLLALNLITASCLLLIGTDSALVLLVWCLIGLSQLLSSTIGRALFYVLVIPTTMPGAFFWKNKGFEAHARDIGLADMPQVGVVPNTY